MNESSMIDTANVAKNILLLLQQDPRRYVNFGAYWWLIKAMLKAHGYTRDNLVLLGDYMPQDPGARMPEHADGGEALAAALDEYTRNVSFNLGSSEVADYAGGGTFTLLDPDAGPAS